MDNESLNSIIETIMNIKQNTLTLPCFDPTFRCVNLKYRIDYSFKIRIILCLAFINRKQESNQVRSIL